MIAGSGALDKETDMLNHPDNSRETQLCAHVFRPFLFGHCLIA